MWYWQKHRNIDKWSRIENPEVDLHNYTQLIFVKEAQQFTEEVQPFNKWCQGKKISLVLNLTPYIKMNSMWSQNEIKHRTVNLQKKIGENFWDLGKEFLDLTSRA